jgi:hypothetical protein
MEEKILDQDYQRVEEKQCNYRICQPRDKDMTDFYIIRIKGE